MEKETIKKSSFLVVSHVLYRKIGPVEGPYSSVIKALKGKAKKIMEIKVPLFGYKNPINFGNKEIGIPSFFGILTPIKYLTDFFITLFLIAKFNLDTKGDKVVIGIDPLSTIPAIALKPFFKYKLIFYSVDFNETRFNNPLMQGAYELFDKWASVYSNQTWVVCESLREYKKKNYKVEAIYIPNSAMFDPSLSKRVKKKRKGNKLAWTGTLITERSYGILFGVIKKICEIRPDLEVLLVPIRDHEKFQKIIDDNNYKNIKIVKLTSRRAWQEFVAKCDVGLAVYDDKFGSTKYIEPLKIWDFMLCGVPFIISSEPSISKPVIDSKVCYLLGPANSFPDKVGLKRFLEKKNLESLFPKCLKLSQNFSIDKRIQKSLAKL